MICTSIHNWTTACRYTITWSCKLSKMAMWGHWGVHAPWCAHLMNFNFESSTYDLVQLSSCYQQFMTLMHTTKIYIRNAITWFHSVEIGSYKTSTTWNNLLTLRRYVHIRPCVYVRKSETQLLKRANRSIVRLEFRKHETILHMLYFWKFSTCLFGNFIL